MAITEMNFFSGGGGALDLIYFEIDHPTVNSTTFNYTIKKNGDTIDSGSFTGTNQGNSFDFTKSLTINGRSVEWHSQVVYGTTPQYTLPVEMTIDGVQMSYTVIATNSNYSSVCKVYFNLTL